MEQAIPAPKNATTLTTGLLKLRKLSIVFGVMNTMSPREFRPNYEIELPTEIDILATHIMTVGESKCFAEVHL